MSLSDRLRAALAEGHRRTPALLPGDLPDEDAAVGQPMPAAVLVPVVDLPSPTVILTLRPDTMRKHPGQISFPGGRIDPGDDGPIGAALREAEEEIGLAREHVEVVGITDRYRTITGFEVTPVVGVLPPGLPLVGHPGEVAAMFEAPLDYLLDPANQVEREAQWRGQTRRYYEIAYDGRSIWGATAAMIVNLGRRLAWTS